MADAEATLRMVGAAGIEPATVGLEIRCSIRLSYAPIPAKGHASGLPFKITASLGFQETATNLFSGDPTLWFDARRRSCQVKPRIPAAATTLGCNMKGTEFTYCRSALHVPFPVCPDPAHDHEPEA